MTAGSPLSIPLLRPIRHFTWPQGEIWVRQSKGLKYAGNVITIMGSLTDMLQIELQEYWVLLQPNTSSSQPTTPDSVKRKFAFNHKRALPVPPLPPLPARHLPHPLPSCRLMVHPPPLFYASRATPQLAVQCISYFWKDFKMFAPDLFRKHGVTGQLPKKALKNQSGFVYILQNDTLPSRVKIGKCTNSLSQLRHRYATCFPDQTRIWAVKVSNCRLAEKEMHNLFSKHREAGEWFSAGYLESFKTHLSSYGKVIVFTDN